MRPRIKQTTRRIGCFAVALMLSACAGHRSSPGDAEIMDVVNGFHAAFSTEDAERVGAMLSDDPSFIFFGTGPDEIQTSRQHFLDKHQSQDWAMLDDISFGPLEHTNIQSSPELAVVMYETTLDFTADGARASMPVRLTLTLVNEEGRWKIRQGLAALIAR